jgi:nucleotide-binding universal stress UspA family protein
LDSQQRCEESAAPPARTVLVAIDFSDCSRLAIHKARTLAGQGGRILALHVIERDFVKRCIRLGLGDEGQIKKTLFLRAKQKLRDLLRGQGLDGQDVEMVVCEGVPFLEINRRAVEGGAEMIIMGTCGKAAGMNAIFFGNTTEKVLRFITRPVLCVPPGVEYRME